tara:strand:- start:44 stop:166 length:123 start_codon:yes stop_codon:yes gene_type:complete
MDVSVEKLLQLLGEEVVKNRLLEETLASLEAQQEGQVSGN